jgi:hypothetical protein
MSREKKFSNLPLENKIDSAWKLSIILTLIMVILSLLGLFMPGNIYKEEALIQTYMTNDVVNLLIGLPIMLGSLWLARRGKLVGLLCWPGALLFIIYNYIAYMFGMPVGYLSLAYLVLILLCSYNVYALISKIDNHAVKAKLSGAVAEKLAGWFLFIFGILFILRALIEYLGATQNQEILTPPDISVLLADVVISILWISGGVLLLRRMPLGYTSGLGLLFVASTLFLGLIIFLFIQPVLTTAVFNLIDLVVVAVMGLILSVPFFFYLRGTLKAE